MELQDVSTRKVVIPGRALQTLVTGKASGIATVFDPSDESVYWHLYFAKGNLNYATSGMGQKVRLTYLLRQLFPNTQFPIPDHIDGHHEYPYLNKVLGAGKLSTKQIQKVLYFLTQEAVSQVLSLPRAAISFEVKQNPLTPALLSLSLRSMVRPLQEQIRGVAKLRTVIGSPFQRLQLGSDEDTTQPDLDIADCFSFKGLTTQLVAKRTLYELSLQTTQTTLTLGNLIKPLVYAGKINVLPFDNRATTAKPLIACIDDSRATQRIVKMTLEAGGYQVLNITDSAKALSTFVQQRPALILMDINMPDINGYELCKMLKQSNILKEIPVVMLTGRDGLLDRMRARMVGSSDYIAKPFQPQELIQLVQSYTAEGSQTAKTIPPKVAPNVKEAVGLQATTAGNKANLQLKPA